MFYNENQISRETDDILEFQYNRKLMYIYASVLILLYLFMLVQAAGLVPGTFLVGSGIVLSFIGIIPWITSRKIIADKNRKQLILSFGAGNLFRRIKVFHFSQIRTIEIKESPLSIEIPLIVDLKDTIFLNLENENNYKLAVSKSGQYSNELSFKLSGAIGCKVVCVRF